MFHSYTYCFIYMFFISDIITVVIVVLQMRTVVKIKRHYNYWSILTCLWPLLVFLITSILFYSNQFFNISNIYAEIQNLFCHTFKLRWFHLQWMQRNWGSLGSTPVITPSNVKTVSYKRYLFFYFLPNLYSSNIKHKSS